MRNLLLKMMIMKKSQLMMIILKMKMRTMP